MLRAAETIERTDTGRQRRGNEDSSYARAPVFVVADGMGGAQAGEVASRIAVEAFAQGLPQDGTPEERLVALVQTANQRIHELSRSESERAGMGTTLTAAYLDDTNVAIAHVGDSRAYLFRDSELTRLTRDHTLVEALVEQGKLTEEQALEHPQRSIITRALGPESVVEVDTWTYPVRPGDVVLLCSDGLTSMLPEERIGQILATVPSLERAADQLIAEANEAGGRDNITVVLFRVESVGDDGALDAPTVVGMSPVEAPADTAQASDVPIAPPPAPRPSPPPKPRKARLARLQGHGPLAHRHRRERPFGRLGKTVATLVTIAIVVGVLAGGGYLASRQLYFVGTNAQGIVTIYRGLPYDLPLGIRLYETFYVSGVPASSVPPARRSTLLNHHLRSQSDASGLVRALELGQLSG